jgi:hypothetical protein
MIYFRITDLARRTALFRLKVDNEVRECHHGGCRLI